MSIPLTRYTVTLPYKDKVFIIYLFFLFAHPKNNTFYYNQAVGGNECLYDGSKIKTLARTDDTVVPNDFISFV